jgi:hypothetical protein
VGIVKVEGNGVGREYGRFGTSDDDVVGKDGNNGEYERSKNVETDKGFQNDKIRVNGNVLYTTVVIIFQEEAKDDGFPRASNCPLERKNTIFGRDCLA